MTNIFISYSPQDIKFKVELETHLSVLKRKGLIDTWTDQEIRVGENWTKEIQRRLEKADLIIPLISANYLASDFIYNIELEKILFDENKNILPLIVKPCNWQSIDWLRKRQVFPQKQNSISSFENRDEAFFEFTSVLSNWLKEIQTDSENYPKPSLLEEDINKVLTSKFIFVSHCHEDGDFAELLKLRLEKEGFQVWVDTDRLKIGQVWREEIDQAIKKSSAFIVVMTPEARNSEYVTYEWAFAWGKDIKIFPIQLKPTTFHPRLESLQYLDFSNRESRPWDKLISGLK